MKLLLLFAAILFASLLGGCSSTSSSCPECAQASAITNGPSSNAPGELRSFEFTTHEGKTLRLEDLRGTPAAISFVYTRCQNQRKCPLVARTMAELRTDLERNAIEPVPNLILITYDPEFDTPEILKDFGDRFGFLSGNNTFLLRPDPATKGSLFRALNVGVNFYGDSVNTHGIQLFLLDKEGRVAKSHRGLIWDNRQVVTDLNALARAL